MLSDVSGVLAASKFRKYAIQDQFILQPEDEDSKILRNVCIHL